MDFTDTYETTITKYRKYAFLNIAVFFSSNYLFNGSWMRCLEEMDMEMLFYVSFY